MFIDIIVDIVIDSSIDKFIDILTDKEEGGGRRKERVDFFLKSNNPTPEGGEKLRNTLKILRPEFWDDCFFDIFLFYDYMLTVIAFLVLKRIAFRHNSVPRARIWVKRGGNCSYKPPGAVLTLQSLHKPQGNQNVETKNV